MLIGVAAKRLDAARRSSSTSTRASSTSPALATRPTVDACERLSGAIHELAPQAFTLAQEAGDVARTEDEHGRALALFAMAHGLRMLATMPDRPADDAAFMFDFATAAEPDRPACPRASYQAAAGATLAAQGVCS